MLLSVERPNRGSLCLSMTRGHAAALDWSGASSPAGVGLEHGRRNIEVSQELGRVLLFAPRQFPVGDTGLPTPGSDSALVWQRAKTTSATEVSPSEGNEVRRDGGRMS